MCKDVLELISQKQASLSKGKRSIATYILENPNEASLMTAAILGKTVKVSESSVVRFAGDLGYRGYPELQKALQSVLMDHLHVVKQEGTTQHYVPNDNRLHPIKDQISADDLQVGADLLQYCNRIYVYSSEELDYGVHYFMQGCKEMFLSVTMSYSKTDDAILKYMSPLSCEDTLVCFLSSGDKMASFLCAYALRIGAKLICFTDTSYHIPTVDGGIVYSTHNLDGEHTSKESQFINMLCSFFSHMKQQGREVFSARSCKFKEMQEMYNAYDTEKL